MGHTLRLLPSAPYQSQTFICNLCNEPGSGHVYHCSSGCTFDLHVACAAMDTQHTHISHHNHPLRLKQREGDPSLACTCGSCGLNISSPWSFQCDPCNFNLHSVCARAPRFMMHAEHSHVLRLVLISRNAAGTIYCSGCGVAISRCNYYSCPSCDFHLHQACATLSKKIKDSKHQAHMLTLLHLSPPQMRCRCKGCNEIIEGWHYNCGVCNHFSLHPLCADIIHYLPHEDNLAAHDETGTREGMRTNAARNEAHLAVAARMALHGPSQCTEMPSSLDFDALKRVLRYAEEMMEANMMPPHTVARSRARGQEDQTVDQCPTCLEDFEPANPQKLTSCGHAFHLGCILGWMERSSSCPICRNHITLVD